MEYGRLPTVPEYYKEWIDGSVNLIDDTKQCCPFHNEDTPSFSYKRETGVWSCFGGCKIRGAGVVKMHQMKFKLNNMDEAEDSLRSIYRCPKKEVTELVEERIIIHESAVLYKKLVNRAILLANTPEKCVELDTVMTYYPPEVYDIRELLQKWGVKEDLY